MAKKSKQKKLKIRRMTKIKPVQKHEDKRKKVKHKENLSLDLD